MLAKNDLKSLWEKRDFLTEAEWDELYRLIFSILKRSNPSILRALPESKDYYIQDFILLKVLEPAKRNSASPYGENELCSYFNNFLHDVKRSASLGKIIFVEKPEEAGGSCGEPHDDSPPDREFFEYRITHQDVLQHAQAFLDQLDEIGRIYLALHACADAPEPLYKLAERLRIPSHHYKAIQLGITRKKGEFGDDYKSTQIGRWLREVLGLELSANAAVLTALKILCHESLLQVSRETELR